MKDNSGGYMSSIKEIYEYRSMIFSLARRELRGKYEKSVLGFLWAFLGPMFQILIYGLVFTVIYHNGLPNYYIFLMTGMLPWTFFSDSIGSGTGAIVSNAEMVKKIYFPRETLVLSEVLAKLVNMLLSFIVMAGFILVSRVGFSYHVILLPLIIFSELLLATGCAFLVAALTVYFRDLEYIVNVILMAWIWGTPIMYEMDSVTSPVFHRLLELNPLSNVICAYHAVLYYHTFPTISNVVVPIIEGTLITIVGYTVFNRVKKHFVEEL